jgi:hypothetical protein
MPIKQASINTCKGKSLPNLKSINLPTPKPTGSSQISQSRSGKKIYEQGKSGQKRDNASAYPAPTIQRNETVHFIPPDSSEAPGTGGQFVFLPAQILLA